MLERGEEAIGAWENVIFHYVNLGYASAALGSGICPHISARFRSTPSTHPDPARKTSQRLFPSPGIYAQTSNWVLGLVSLGSKLGDLFICQLVIEVSL